MYIHIYRHGFIRTVYGYSITLIITITISRSSSIFLITLKALQFAGGCSLPLSQFSNWLLSPPCSQAYNLCTAFTFVDKLQGAHWIFLEYLVWDLLATCWWRQSRAMGGLEGVGWWLFHVWQQTFRSRTAVSSACPKTRKGLQRLLATGISSVQFKTTYHGTQTSRMTHSRRWQTFPLVQQAALRSFERLLVEHERLLRQIAIDKASEARAWWEWSTLFW